MVTRRVSFIRSLTDMLDVQSGVLPKLLLCAGISYLFVPLDLIPDRLPWIGHFDEVGSVLLGIFLGRVVAGRTLAKRDADASARLQSALASNAVPPPERKPSVSVVICSHDRLNYVRACMQSLAGQSVGADGFEIILVDSGSPAPVAAEMRRIAEAAPNARLLRLDVSGVSLARNEGARVARSDYVAYIDDDAMATPDWVEQIQYVLAQHGGGAAVLGGKVLPKWESPLPAWWPQSLRGVLSIIEHEGAGEYRTEAVPATLEPYGVNMILRRDLMLQLGGFAEALGRLGLVLQSDEDVQLAWRLQDAGYSAIYDSRVVVRHSIQARRFRAEWLLARLYWQGVSTVRTRRLLGRSGLVWRELPRRLLVEVLTLPFAWTVPKQSTWLMALRWRHAYASGFTRETLAHGVGKRSLFRRRLTANPT